MKEIKPIKYSELFSVSSGFFLSEKIPVKWYEDEIDLSNFINDHKWDNLSWLTDEELYELIEDAANDIENLIKSRCGPPVPM